MRFSNLVQLVQRCIVFEALRAVILPIFRILPHQIKQEKNGRMLVIALVFTLTGCCACLSQLIVALIWLSLRSFFSLVVAIIRHPHCCRLFVALFAVGCCVATSRRARRARPSL
jgi:hypothetical protein